MGNSRLRRRNRQWVHDFKRDHAEDIKKREQEIRNQLNQNK